MSEKLFHTDINITGNRLKNAIIEDGVKIYRGIAGTGGIIAHRAIAVIGDRVVHFDKDNMAHYNRCIGFSLQSASQGTLSDIAIEGAFEVGLPLINGGLYYSDVSGLFTLTPPTSGIVQAVAIAISSSKLLVKLSQPIIKI